LPPGRKGGHDNAPAAPPASIQLIEIITLFFSDTGGPVLAD
jgi:hypothetical protein